MTEQSFYELLTLVTTGIGMLLSLSYWGGRISNKLDTLIKTVGSHESKIDKIEEKVNRHEAYIEDLRRGNKS